MPSGPFGSPKEQAAHQRPRGWCSRRGEISGRELRGTENELPARKKPEYNDNDNHEQGCFDPEKSKAAKELEAEDHKEA